MNKTSNITRLLADWKSDPDFLQNLVYWMHLPHSEITTKPFPINMEGQLIQSLINQGIQGLYDHQLEAWYSICKGVHTMIVTGTASGKTLCYNLPILNHFIQNSESCSLFLFPTKALAQDQAYKLATLLKQFDNINPSNNSKPFQDPSNSIIGLYDGDTHPRDRISIREYGKFIFTNPDMLHLGILPNHPQWKRIFENLNFIVIDEAHSYRGVFGSHVANVLRRLKRIAKHYYSKPVIILTSATISNPNQFANKFIEEDLVVIKGETFHPGDRDILIYNPPLINSELGIRQSIYEATQKITKDIQKQNVQTIVFTKSRKSVEILTRNNEKIVSSPTSYIHNPSTIKPYRSGYLPQTRRSIEKGLRDGQIRLVFATNALELGIDIGDIQATVLIGYPGSISSTWQQFGRASRQIAGKSVNIIILAQDPMNQYLANHPQFIFESSHEEVLIDPNNLLILLSHLQCTLFELPWGANSSFGKIDNNILQEMIEVLALQGHASKMEQKYFWIGSELPEKGVSLRSTSSDRLILQLNQGSDKHIIGYVDFNSADWLTHPGAVYLHEGEIYKVVNINFSDNTVNLVPHTENYYTEPKTEHNVTMLAEIQSQNVSINSKKLGSIAYGDLTISSQVVGYQKFSWEGNYPFAFEELDLPQKTLVTKGFWITLDEYFIEDLRANTLWIDDPNEYGPDWKLSRQKVRSRDGFKCQICGKPETSSEHDVHHKKPFRSFIDKSQANSMDNLITLCKKCHREAENSVRVKGGLAGAGFLLYHISPILLMSDTRDIAVISESAARFSSDKPTILIYDLTPGGIGFSESLYNRADVLFKFAYERISKCTCLDGCPSCTGPGGEYGLGSKQHTLAIITPFAMALNG